MKSKSIKTITCHNVYNYGASLQAYALVRYIKDLGFSNVEIIDYKPDYLSRHYKLSGVNNPKYDKPVLRNIYQALKFPKRLVALFGKRKHNFDLFTNRFLPLTSKRYISNEELKEDIPYADIYIAGSDQIWNSMFPNGKDPAFFLDFAPDTSVRASFAASFAVDRIDQSIICSVKKWLSRFDYISVREETGMRILSKLGITNGTVVLDPVFLLERDSWDELCTEKTATRNDYLLIYDFDKSETIKEAATRIAIERGLRILTFQKLDYGDECFSNSGPLEFLTLIKNASFIISNSFHATAFALIFEKDFLIVNRNCSINSRMSDLLSSIGLEERIIDTSDFDIQISSIDYEIVNRILNQQVKHSKEFLCRVLKGDDLDND